MSDNTIEDMSIWFKAIVQNVPDNTIEDIYLFGFNLLFKMSSITPQNQLVSQLLENVSALNGVSMVFSIFFFHWDVL